MGRKAKEVDSPLRVHRLRAGWRSLTKFAAEINYSKDHLSSVERGKAKPSAELVSKYEEKLGLPPGTIAHELNLNGKEPPPAPGVQAAGTAPSTVTPSTPTQTSPIPPEPPCSVEAGTTPTPERPYPGRVRRQRGRAANLARPSHGGQAGPRRRILAPPSMSHLRPPSVDGVCTPSSSPAPPAEPLAPSTTLPASRLEMGRTLRVALICLSFVVSTAALAAILTTLLRNADNNPTDGTRFCASQQTALLCEDFDEDGRGGISPVSGQQWNTPVIIDGKYIVQVPGPGPHVFATISVSGRYENVVISMDVQLTGDTLRRHLNVACRNTGTNQFYISLYPALKTVYFKAGIGASERDIKSKQSEAINPDSGEINHVELSCIGQTITLKINGQYVDSIVDEQPQEGVVWFGVGRGDEKNDSVWAAFDNVVLSRD